MKKTLTYFVLGTVLILSLAGCSQQGLQGEGLDSSVTDGTSVTIFRGVIDEITGSTATIIPNKSETHILSSGDKVNVNLSVSSSEFVIGDEVVVYYTGELMESYPLSIFTVDVKSAEDFDNEIKEGDETQKNQGIEDIGGELLPDQPLDTSCDLADPGYNTGEHPSDDFMIIETEIIINVTRDYDGTISQELEALGVIAVDKIFDAADTVMYLITTEKPVDNIIQQLESIDYIHYAEYNQTGIFFE